MLPENYIIMSENLNIFDYEIFRISYPTKYFIYIHTYICVCVCVCVCVCIYICIYTYEHIYTYIYIHIYICTYVYIYVYICICIYIDMGVWVGSGSWWWTGRPGVLWFMGSQTVKHDWQTELNWTIQKEASTNLELSFLY